MVVVAGEPEELHVEVLLKEDCAAAVDPGVGRGGVKAGSDDSIRDPPVVRASFTVAASTFPVESSVLAMQSS